MMLNDLVDAFERREDVYKKMAAAIYGKEEADITKDERFVGKTTILGAGYGMGAAKFQGQLKNFGVEVTLEEAKRIIDELISTGKSTRPVLGVFFDTTYTGSGAKIARLSAGEGADKAGIPVGSIIKSIDGIRITDQVAAIVKIRSYAPGAKVTVVVDLPSGGSKSFNVTLGSAASS